MEGGQNHLWYDVAETPIRHPPLTVVSCIQPRACLAWSHAVATNRYWNLKGLSGVEKRDKEGAAFTLLFELGRR